MILERDSSGQYLLKWTRDSGPAIAPMCNEWEQATGHELPNEHYQQIRLNVEAVGQVRPVTARPAVEETAPEAVPEPPPVPEPQPVDERGILRVDPASDAPLRGPTEAEIRQQRGRLVESQWRVNNPAATFTMHAPDEHWGWAYQEVLQYERRAADDKQRFIESVFREVERRRSANRAHGSRGPERVRRGRPARDWER